MINKIKGWIVITAIAVGLQMMVTRISGYFEDILVLAGINAILAVSLNWVNGLSGQFSLGQAGFMAIGAYASSYVSMFVFHSPNHSIWGQQGVLIFSLLVGGGVSGLVGYLIGIPVLRLKGDYLAIATLGFLEIVKVVLYNVQCVGGAEGLAGIPQTTTPFLVFFILGGSVLITYRFLHSRHGRALISIRENEVAAASLGIPTTFYKVQVFVVSAVLAGMAGGLFAHYLSYINPSSFGIMMTLEIVIMVVLGGMGSTSGSVLAAFFLTILPEALRPVQHWTGIDLRMVLYALILIFVMIMRPQGILGCREIWDVLPRKKKNHP